MIMEEKIELRVSIKLFNKQFVNKIIFLLF